MTEPVTVGCRRCGSLIPATEFQAAADANTTFTCDCGRLFDHEQIARAVQWANVQIARRLAAPTEPRELARRDDPATSQTAAREMIASLPAARRHALEAVQQHPGHTSNELARRMQDGDPRKINRRLGELERAGLVVRGSPRACAVSGRQAATWSPS